jgi:hypothetical protein
MKIATTTHICGGASEDNTVNKARIALTDQNIFMVNIS